MFSFQVDFEKGNEGRVATVFPSNIHDNKAGLVYLDSTDSMVDVSGKVPYPGQYIFVIHYYQPDHPGNCQCLICDKRWCLTF